MSNPEESSLFIDPDPNSWLDDDRIRFLNYTLSPLFSFLKSTNLSNQVLLAWIGKEIEREANHCESIYDKSFLNWSNAQWGHSLETMYLQNKTKLDKIDCRLLSVSDKNLSYELYHRLKANEESFESLLLKYSIGPERFRGGRFENQSLSSFPKSLQFQLLSMEEGGILKPFAYNNGYSILVLDRRTPAEFDETTRENLLTLEFERWSEAMLPFLERHLSIQD